jgi:hypothetical protein
MTTTLDAILAGEFEGDDKPVSRSNFFDITKSPVTPQHIQMLAPYLAAISNMETANETNAPSLLAKLSKGLELATSACASATFHYNRSKSKLKKIQGIYFLEKFYDYVKEQEAIGIKIKETDSSREHFVNTREEVIDAAAEVAYYEAVQEQLSGMKMTLTMAISGTKAIVYSNRTSDSLSSFAN